MKTLLLVCLLFTLTLSALNCTSDEVYVKFTKTCGKYASEESFTVLNGETLLQTSPEFANFEVRDLEYCLPANSNYQYNIKLHDSRGDSWSSGSWIKASGIYGNVVFSGFMIEKYDELFTFSLYYGIMKEQQWKVQFGQTQIASEWNTLSFSDADWTEETLGSATSTTSGTQYFRKTFTGLADMAAYELQMNYKYGIIAYINGKEVFRDYMPAGDITPATAATGSYQEIGYHGVIRPASEVAATSSILAVELHFPEGTSQTTIDFDAYLAIYASEVANDRCYIYGGNVEITATSGTEGILSFNYNKDDFYLANPTDLPATLTYDFTGARPFINSIRVWPRTSVPSAPGNFKWQGSLTSGSTANWINIINAVDASYTSKQYKVFSGYFNSNLYKSYRLTDMTPVSDNKLKAYEIQPLICASAVPTSIEFPETSYSFYATYETVYIKPLVTEFAGCTASPTLPSGLTIDSNTCIISGIVLTASPSKTYTISSTMLGQTYTGTFTLEITECSGTYVNILRTYKSFSTYETFTIKDDATQEVVLDVQFNKGQVNYEDVNNFLCLTGNVYTITTGSNYDNWQPKSDLYIQAVLPNDDYENVGRVRYDVKLGIPSVAKFSAKFSVKPVSQWYYKMGEVPANWYNSETSGWQQSLYGSFPESSNQIQLYKHTFNVDSTANLAGFVISLRYKYGCIIYLNGHEAFRNGVTGDLSTSSLADNSYSDLKYRKISLPIKTMPIGNEQSVEYIKQGSNTIAIALVAINANQKTSVFDCALRIMSEGSASRVWDYTITAEGISGAPKYACYFYYSYSMNSNTCTDNAWTIAFNDDRREYVSSVSIYLYYQQGNQQPDGFTLKARNNNEEEWTTIQTVTGMTWSLIGQHKKVWIENNKPYNQYRLENINAGEGSCSWKIGCLDFSAESTTVAIPDLTYPETIEIYKDIEMGEIYSNSEYYYDFTINPALPEGITMDPNNGMISGTATTVAPSTVHTITAKKFGSGEVTVNFNFAVGVCSGGKGLVTLVVRTDYSPEKSGYKVHKGKDEDGEVVTSLDEFKMANTLNYGDFCLPHSIYTLEITDSNKSGWSTPAGYYLTVDLGEMVIETGQVTYGYAAFYKKFTTNMPFQIEYDSWKLYNAEEAPAANWNAIDFDDAAWEVKKAADFGSHYSNTAYIRYDVTIPDIADYYVLNVRMKYAGGVVAYFNGRKVARFNLEENYQHTSEALTSHDASLFSKFHVILSTVGAVTGKNVMAFEVHRTASESNIIFDATGIFGVEDCSIVVDSYSELKGDVSGTNTEGLFDLKPQTSGYVKDDEGSCLEWTVENLEGSKFNSFGAQSIYSHSGFAFSVYARWRSSEDYVSAIAIPDADTHDRRRDTWPMAVGLAGFREYKFEFDESSYSHMQVYSYVMEYCKPSGTGVCPGIGDYPSVGEGQISPSSCPEGFRGYSYRNCTEGQLSEIQNDQCIYKLPDKLTYSEQSYTFVQDTDVTTGKPTYANIITKFYMQEDTPLPEGLTINAETGEISGIPTKTIDSAEYIVRGSNPSGETVVTVNIAVRKGVCQPEGIFERTTVGEVFVYDCAQQGSFVGKQKRACILGPVDGVWQKASGFCMPIYVLVIIIVVAILVVVIAILLILRTRKAKAVGGVKGKKDKMDKKAKVEKKVTKV